MKKRFTRCCVWWLLLLCTGRALHAQNALFGPTADSLQNATHSTFISSNGNYYLQNNAGHTGFNYWWNAHGIDVLADGYLRNRSTTIRTRMKNLLNGIRITNGNTYINTFYDDMEWLAISSLRAYEATADVDYLNVANLLWTDIKTGQDMNHGGAIAWNKSSPEKLHACSNGPAIIFAARLYRISQNPADLATAQSIYAWQKATLVDPVSGAVWDAYNSISGGIGKSIYSYNIGTYIGAAVELYKITGDTSYRADAVKSAEYVLNNRLTNGVLFANEGGGDGGLFKGIFVRYLALLARETNLPAATRDRYNEVISNNARILQTRGINRSTVMVSPNWGVAPAGNTDYSTQLSAVMLAEAAATLDQAFFYRDINYRGPFAMLPAGTYYLAGLQARGMVDNDITSYTLPAGFQTALYENDSLKGTSINRTAGEAWIGTTWNDRVSSIILNPGGVTDLSGTFYIQNRHSGLYMNVKDSSQANGATVEQANFHGRPHQQFTLTHLGNGAYRITPVHSGKSFDVFNGDIANGGKIIQWPWGSQGNQQFIFMRTDDGYYKIWNRKSNKQIEVKDYGVSPGMIIQQWQDVNQLNGQWQLVPVVPVTSPMTVTSPDGQTTVSVILSGQQLSYSVTKNSIQQISNSPLGINTSVGDFTSGLSFISYSTAIINETYQLPSGKTSSYQNHCREMTIRVLKGAKEMQLVMRAYNDGIAFRYQVPGSGNINVLNENSGFTVNAFDSSWAMKYVADYSTEYKGRNWSATALETLYCAPVLARGSGGRYLLITEAANYGNYSVSKLKPGAVTGQFLLEQTGSITTTLPLSTPWRAAILGELPRIVESSLIENLNPPSVTEDFSWIRPGRASWDWGGEDASPTPSLALTKKYIDLAADMHWEYMMIDDGWKNAGYSISDAVAYGNTKGVGIHLWANHSEFQNDEAQIRTLLQTWKGWGIKGIKVDFWEDDNQAMIQKYDKLLKVSAELQLLVNLHGNTKPSGTRRKWPHLLTSEAVYGGEFYLFNSTIPKANHNITLSLTRNVIGPMDYTPLDFARRNQITQQNNTWAHQLALGVVYESGIQHMTDAPQNYQYHISKRFLRQLPVAWDEIRCLEAAPDRYTTIARRKGQDWYIGSLTDAARTLNINLSFLDAGKTYYAVIYKDGVCDTEIEIAQQTLTQGATLNIPLRARGGVTIHLSTQPSTVPAPVKYEGEAAGNTFSGVTNVVDADNRCSGSRYAGNLGNGNYLVFNNVNVTNTGNYILTVYYMSAESRGGYIKVNSSAANNYTYSSTGHWGGKGIGMRSFEIPLNAGNNTIEFGNTAGWSVNIDRITIQSPESVDPGVAGTFYQHCNYDTSGYAVTLGEGDYTQTVLKARGINNNDISSLKVTSGYQVILYDADNFEGSSVTITSNNGCLTSVNFNDRASSLRIRPTAPAVQNKIAAVQTVTPEPISSRFRIYPNPADDHLIIEGVENNQPVRIFDNTGRLLITTTIKAGRISLHSLAKGIYHLVLSTKEGNTQFSFIKR
ncbi:MAG TPA: glycoside hydrolase family 97 catalytic domain-containing protein [Pseudobacter sp.]|nr:glycoside hydrolase family 97 catalytic domain-containing protein [Pseudobacter sp.]